MDNDTKPLSDFELMAASNRLQADLRRAATDAGIVQIEMAIFLTLKATEGGGPAAVDIRRFMAKLADAHPYLRRAWPDVVRIIDESVIPSMQLGPGVSKALVISGPPLIVEDSLERPHLPPPGREAGILVAKDPCAVCKGTGSVSVSNALNTYQMPCPVCKNASALAELAHHPDPEIRREIEADAAIATRTNFKAGVDHCPLCELGLPRVPSNISEEFVHTAVAGDDRVICARRS